MFVSLCRLPFTRDPERLAVLDGKRGRCDGSAAIPVKIFHDDPLSCEERSDMNAKEAGVGTQEDEAGFWVGDCAEQHFSRQTPLCCGRSVAVKS